MNKADVRAPALIALDLSDFPMPRGRLPEDLEVHVVLPQIPDRLAQFAGANPAVKIDNRRCFSRSAWHGPASPALEVLELSPVVKRQSAHINRLLEPLHQPVPVMEHPFGIGPLDARQLRINPAQPLALDFLQTRILRISSNQVGIVAVGNPLPADEFCQGKNLVHIVARDHRIDVHDQSETEFRFQSPQQAPAFQCLFEIARYTAHEIMAFPQAVQRNVDMQLEAAIASQNMLGNFVNPMGFEPIRRQIDVSNSVIADKEIDNLR